MGFDGIRRSRSRGRRRPRFISPVLFGLLLAPLAVVFAAASDEPPRVSIILSSDADPYLKALEGVKASFPAAPGVKFHEHNLKSERPAALAEAVARENPRLIIALGTPALSLSRENFPGVPVVFCMTLASPETPAGNATGVTLDIPLWEKLRKIKGIFPELKSVGIIHSPAYPLPANELSLAERELGMKAVVRRIGTEKEIPGALEDIRPQVDFFLMVPDPQLFTSHSAFYILHESAKNLFPVAGLSSYYTKAGALFSIDCDYRELGRQSAEMAGRVLAGERPADIPVAGPRRLTYSLNAAAAKRMKIYLPDETLRKAESVYGQ